MFINFDDVFNIQKPQSESVINEDFINCLNAKAPNGMYYVKESDSLCVLRSDEEIHISGLEFDISDELREKLNNDVSIERIVKYMYNSQKTMPLKIPDDGYLVINNKKVHLRDLAIGPGVQYEKTAKTFVMAPPDFGAPFSLTVGCENFEKTLCVHRVANDSLDINSFESDKLDSLVIRYTVNNTTQALSLNVKLELANASNVSDMVAAAEIYNAFILGKGYFASKDYLITQGINNASIFDESIIDFWKKVLRIEEALNVSFDSPKTSIDNGTVLRVEELYQNIVNLVPIKTHDIVSSLNGTAEPQKSEIETGDKAPIIFIVSDYILIKLFGKNIKLPALMIVFNSRISKTRKTKENYFVYLCDESDDRRRYLSRMFFKTEADIETFTNNLSDDKINMFKDAHYPEEYLQD